MRYRSLLRLRLGLRLRNRGLRPDLCNMVKKMQAKLWTVNIEIKYLVGVVGEEL